MWFTRYTKGVCGWSVITRPSKQSMTCLCCCRQTADDFVSALSKNCHLVEILSSLPWSFISVVTCLSPYPPSDQKHIRRDWALKNFHGNRFSIILLQSHYPCSSSTEGWIWSAALDSSFNQWYTIVFPDDPRPPRAPHPGALDHFRFLLERPVIPNLVTQ